MEQKSEIIIYQTDNNETRIQERLQDETVWLNHHQMADLFARVIKTIGKHFNNIFDERELIKNSVDANFATTAEDGKTYQVKYNLQAKRVCSNSTGQRPMNNAPTGAIRPERAKARTNK